jgi:hypothetical protein
LEETPTTENRETLSTETETQSKGEAGTEFPVLRVVRPDLSERCRPEAKIDGDLIQDKLTMELRPWSRKHGNGDAGMAGEYPDRNADQTLSSFSRTTRLDSEGQWETTSVGNTNGAGPRGADGHAADSGADLRS